MKDSIFKVYDTAGLQTPQEVLYQISDAPEEEGFELESFTGETAQRTIQHHRDSVRPDDEYYSNLFLVVDRPNVSEHGVLMVSLDAFEGYFDGLRIETGLAGDAVGSLSIFNTDWHEHRDDYDEERTNLKPSGWFALYDGLPSGQEASFRLAFKAMNDGLGVLDFGDDGGDGNIGDSDADDGRGGGDGDGNGNENDSMPTTQRNYYRAVKTRGDEDTSQIIANHAQYAETNRLDPHMFAVVDDADWKDKGVLIVKVTSEDVDSFRRKGPAAGEMLNWIYIGFMTWEEAKNWDSDTIVA